MGAVAEFVDDTVSDTFDAIGDAVEDVGDAVGSVVEKVGGVVEKVLDDPLPVIIAIAGQMVGIPAPLTMAALTAAKGGSLEDIALSAGTAYFAPMAGSALSSTFSSTLIEAGISEGMSEVVSNAVSKGLVNGTVAEIKGGDFGDAFSGGFTGGLVSGGVSELGDYVKPEFVDMANEAGLSMGDANALFKAGVGAVSAGATSEVTGRGDFATAFTNSAINSGVKAGINVANSSIDEQFKTVATSWNENDAQSPPVTVDATGAGIPDDMVAQVEVSDIGVDSTPAPVDPTTPLAVSPDVAAAPDMGLTESPPSETVADFPSLTNTAATDPALEVAAAPAPELTAEPQGGLSAASSTTAPVSPSLEAPALGNMAVADPVATRPFGGLSSNSFTKPLVATAGNLLQQGLRRNNQPANQPQATAAMMRPQGALSAVSRPAAQMDIASLLPIQRAAPVQQQARTAPAQTLQTSDGLTPITNIATLSSLLRKAT